MKRPFKFKNFQRNDYSRAALHDGVILGHDTGGGKGLALFVWPCLKVGFENFAGCKKLKPLKPVLLVAPGDLHGQVMKEGRDKFRADVTPLDSQAKFIALSDVHPQTGQRTLPPGYYIASYTQLASNGIVPFPAFERGNAIGLMRLLGLNENSAVEFFNQRGILFLRQYKRLNAEPTMSAKQLLKAWEHSRRQFEDDGMRKEIDADYWFLENFATPQPDGEFNDLDDAKQGFVLEQAIRHYHHLYSRSIGDGQHYPHGKVKCVYSPALVDLCQDTFAACAVDEGVKMKGEDTIVGLGIRQINAPFKLVLTATPIKNRLPDIFRLAWWATGAKEDAHARFPYPDSSEAREEFSQEFLISERNLTKEQMSEGRRRYLKLTPQVCNVHRLWKMMGPIVLRRRKKDFGEDIVEKIRNVVRVPMGKQQAAVYRFHLDAQYKDRHGKPAIGAQLQALRIAAANPASGLLERPLGDDKTEGPPRSGLSYIPKLVSCLQLIQQILARGEQVVVFSAFHDSLDVLDARLNEAGVVHCVADGRVTQKKRGRLAEQFKLGPPKAFDREPHESPSIYPVMLAGVECMAEGHSFQRCNNVILMCYSWAYDKFEQAINRVHRLNSLWNVNVYPIICDGSIDRKLEAMVQEKGDAAELVLDGHLLGEHQQEVNLWELLAIAQEEFTDANTIDERELEKDWPKLRLQLGKAFQSWQNCEISQSAQALSCSLPKREICPIADVPDNQQPEIPKWRRWLR